MSDMDESVFQDRDRVKEQMDLPAEVDYSFVGASTPEYHAKVEEIIVRVAGEDNIRTRQFRASSNGKYTAYKFRVFHMTFEEVEDIYRQIGKLEGTRFVI